MMKIVELPVKKVAMYPISTIFFIENKSCVIAGGTKALVREKQTMPKRMRWEEQYRHAKRWNLALAAFPAHCFGGPHWHLQAQLHT